MKLIILGRGNAGCISAMHFAHFRHTLKQKVEIELVYDSKIKPVPTGQGTTLQFPNSLFFNFGANYINNFPTTLKLGIMYEDWGLKEKKYFHPFPLGTYALHFSPDEFQDYVCKNLKIDFKERDENIKSYDELDANYIIDCRGKPTKLNNYKKLINPLNCALLASAPKKKNDVKWTRCIATPDGWCFYIPLPKKTSIGYLFNKKITSTQNAKNNFKKMFNIDNIDFVFPFEQYLAKEPIIDNRVLLNGNRLFFLEPLEATAMGSYLRICEFYYNFLFNGSTAENTKNEINTFVNKVQDFILYHYSSGSVYKTNFWKKAETLWKKTNTPELNLALDEVSKMSDLDMQRSYSNPAEFALWPPFSVKQWKDNVLY